MAGDILARWRQSSEVHDVAISPEGENHWWWKQPLERLNALEAQVASLTAENAELEALFDMQRKREAEVFARWRGEGRLPELTLPDYGKAVQWLCEEIEKLTAERDRYREVLAGLVARFTLRGGRCHRCGKTECEPGCEMREARELLEEEAK